MKCLVGKYEDLNSVLHRRRRSLYSTHTCTPYSACRREAAVGGFPGFLATAKSAECHATFRASLSPKVENY